VECDWRTDRDYRARPRERADRAGGKVIIVDPVAMMADLSKAKPADLSW
jgi:hypothetical protein